MTPANSHSTHDILPIPNICLSLERGCHTYRVSAQLSELHRISWCWAAITPFHAITRCDQGQSENSDSSARAGGQGNYLFCPLQQNGRMSTVLRERGLFGRRCYAVLVWQT